MTDYSELQTRCQRGEASLAGASNLLAECHAALGRMIAENARLHADLNGEISNARDFNLEHEELKHERDQLKAENEALRKDAERFAYIERDADSGMSKIYGDDWVAVIDAAMSKGEQP
ncbi:MULTISPECIES: hypothetical protein [Pseudomonas]|uniref:hypothetical protein n=1 Tax=Pseudomonas TaxID=286 RepID=UPI002362409B|nr:MULTISPECIES: hypothetical protein [Pseudomonas]WJV25891.1 hypothetical protein PSR66_07645 [Pseudomonas chlororaphis]